MTASSKLVSSLAAIVLLCLLALTGCGIGSEAARPAEQATPVSTFNMLDQYGEWVTIPVLGEVWRPREAYGWQPYNNGRWIWTDRGWMWAGYEPYAWIVYHYGNWTFDNFAGWVWIPSYEWSPAPVMWVTTDEYVGWAPIPPRGVSLVEFDQDPQMRIWTMVPVQSFVRDDVGKYRTRTAPSRSGTRIPGDNRRGPDVQEVGRLANQRINPMRLETEKVRSGNRQLEKVKVSSSDQTGDKSSSGKAVQPVVPPAAQHPPAQPVVPSAVQSGRTLGRPIEKPAKQATIPTPAPPSGVHVRQPGAGTDSRGGAKKVEKKTDTQEKSRKVVPPKKEEKEKEKPKERKEER